jgi:IS30 family transposase
VSDKYMTLLGAEQVQSAGQTMRSAAEQMQRAASTIDESLERHRRFLDDWLTRFSEVMERKR